MSGRGAPWVPGRARLIGDAVDRGVHRGRREGGVHEGAEAVGEDERPEEVGRVAHDGRLEDELLEDVRGDGEHCDPPVEQLLLEELHLLLARERARDAKRVEAQVARQLRLRVLVELEARGGAPVDVLLLEDRGREDRHRQRRRDLPLVQPAVEQRGRLARGRHQNVLRAAEAGAPGGVDEDRVEDFLQRPRHGRQHRQPAVLDLGLAEGHELLVVTEAERVEAEVADAAHVQRGHRLGCGRVDAHADERGARREGHSRRGGGGEHGLRVSLAWMIQWYFPGAVLLMTSGHFRSLCPSGKVRLLLLYPTPCPAPTTHLRLGQRPVLSPRVRGARIFLRKVHPMIHLL